MRSKKYKKLLAVLLCVFTLFCSFPIYAAGLLGETNASPTEASTEMSTEPSSEAMSDGEKEISTETETTEKNETANSGETEEQKPEKNETEKEEGDQSPTKETETSSKNDEKKGDETEEKKEEAEQEKETGQLYSANQSARADTAISENRDEGIAQIQTVIPDKNFAAAVYDSLATEGHLGTPGESIKAVLASFTGEIKANGYVKRTEYVVTATKTVYDTEGNEVSVDDIEEVFSTKEEAQGFLNSLKNEFPTTIYSGKKLTGPVIIETSELKSDDEMITDISGIEWLRQAKFIDISHNKISDLQRLSVDYLKNLEPEAGDTDIREGQKWFGEKNRNTILSFFGNPIRNFPLEAGGRLDLESLAKWQFNIEVAPIIYIKTDDPFWNTNYDVEIPLVTVDSQKRLALLKEAHQTYIYDNTVLGAVLDRSNLTDEILPITGIASSGNFRAIITGLDQFSRWTVPENDESDNPSYESTSLKFAFRQTFRIFTITQTEPSTNNTTITLDKTVTGTNRPVAGAKFKLYKATVAEDGTYQKGDLYSEEAYITDKKGQITFTDELPVGEYCFVETEAPADFVLDDSMLLGFKVVGGTVKLTGGESTVTPTEGATVNAGENEAYIDRYSPDIDIEITPEEGGELDKVLITYFDRESQAFKSVEVKTATEAAKWINDNKGNENELGVIDGTVKVKAIFKQEISLKAENQRKVTDFQFEKVSEKDETPMQGVEFSLTCTHKHDKSCNGLEKPENCIHVHNDVEGNVDDIGCTWKAFATSNERGIVSFKDLNTGTYILKEEKTLDGFALPEGTWTVTVNVDAEAVDIQKNKDADETTLDFEKKENEDESFQYRLKNKSTVPFSFIKVDEDSKSLKGAEFTLYQGNSEDRDNWKIVRHPISSDETGKVDFGQLEKGEYFLVETKAPSGYQKPTGYWKITIEPGAEDNKKVVFTAEGSVPAIKGSFIEGYQITNIKGSTLPKLGGNGTTIFLAIGIMLMGCSIILQLVHKRKRG